MFEQIDRRRFTEKLAAATGAIVLIGALQILPEEMSVSGHLDTGRLPCAYDAQLSANTIACAQLQPSVSN